MSRVTSRPLNSADHRADAERERQRQIDRHATDDPQHGERIGAEPVHGAEGQVDLADDDDQQSARAT